MIDLKKILEDYSSVGLEEMDSVSFMNRIDSKYVFPVNKLPYLLSYSSGNYKVLEIEHCREFTYNTVYHDTPDYFFYNQHVTGKLGRYKVRVRTYETSGTSYIEVKCKTNKGRTVKTRIKKKPGIEAGNGKGLGFVRDQVSLDLMSLQPVLTNHFSRVTLINFEDMERITLDFNLSFSLADGKSIDLPFLAIAELKRDKSTNHSPFARQLKQMEIRETGFSKYCIGLALLTDVPKKNIFKPKIIMINKIKDEYCKPVIS
jgi:hypothetical protein